MRLNVSYKAAAAAKPVFLRAAGATSVKSRHFTTGPASETRWSNFVSEGDGR